MAPDALSERLGVDTDLISAVASTLSDKAIQTILEEESKSRRPPLTISLANICANILSSALIIPQSKRTRLVGFIGLVKLAASPRFSLKKKNSVFIRNPQIVRFLSSCFSKVSE